MFKMKKKTKEYIVLGAIMVILFAVGLWVVTYSYKVFPSEITERCQSYYNNKTFMARFAYDEPYIPYRCMNITSDENYTRCLLEDSDDYYIVTHCGWMSRDYLILLFRVGILAIFISILMAFLTKTKLFMKMFPNLISTTNGPVY